MPYSPSAPDDLQPHQLLPDDAIPEQPESKEPSSKTAKGNPKRVIGQKMSPKGSKGSKGPAIDHTHAQGNEAEVRDEDDADEQGKAKSKLSSKKQVGKKAVKAKGGGAAKKAEKAKQSPAHQAVHKQRKVAEPSGSEEDFNDTINWLKYLDKDEHTEDREEENGDEGQKADWEDESEQMRLTAERISTLRAIWGHGDESEDDGEQDQAQITAGDNRGRHPTDHRSEGDIGEQAFEDGDENGEWDRVCSGDDMDGSQGEMDGGSDTIRYQGNRPRASHTQRNN